MRKGYLIRKGDKTTCCGEVMETDTRVMKFGMVHARDGVKSLEQSPASDSTAANAAQLKQRR
jgi:hypothetical protein